MLLPCLGQRIKEMGTDATNGKQSGFQNKVVNKLDQVLREITESKENQARNVCKVLQLASEFKKWATRNNQAEGKVNLFIFKEKRVKIGTKLITYPFSETPHLCQYHVIPINNED